MILLSDKKKPKKGQKKGKKKQANGAINVPCAPKLPGICTDFACKSKQAVQAEIIEKVIKDKDKITEENNKLKSKQLEELKSLLTDTLKIDNNYDNKDDLLSAIKQAIKELKESKVVEKLVIEKQIVEMTKLIEPENELITADAQTARLKEGYEDYFRLRDSNVEGRADVLRSLFNHAAQIDLERRKLVAEVEVLRLKD